MDTDGLQRLQLWVTNNVDTAFAICQYEHVIIIVPGDFTDLKLELFLCFGMVCLGLSKGHNFIFMGYSSNLPIRTLADNNVLLLVFTMAVHFLVLTFRI